MDSEHRKGALRVEGPGLHPVAIADRYLSGVEGVRRMSGVTEGVRRMKNSSCNSVVELMNNLRFKIIGRVQKEIDKNALNDQRYGNVEIMNPNKKYKPKKDSISVYIYIEGSMEIDGFADDAADELAIKIRLSDHPSNDLEEGTSRHRNRIRIIILKTINKAIAVRGKNQIECRWSELDRKNQKMLIRGERACLRDGSEIVNAEFSIHPSDEGDVVNEVRREVMNGIHSFVHGVKG